APGPVVAGQPFDVVFSARQADGSVDQSYNGDVTIALTPNPGAPQLFGNPTILANHGVAHFTNLAIDVPGAGYTFTVTSRATTAIAPATSAPFAVNDQLLVTTQPPHQVGLRQKFTVVVTAADGLGKPDPSFTGNVTIVLHGGPKGAKLGGTLI